MLAEAVSIMTYGKSYYLGNIKNATTFEVPTGSSEYTISKADLIAAGSIIIPVPLTQLTKTDLDKTYIGELADTNLSSGYKPYITYSKVLENTPGTFFFQLTAWKQDTLDTGTFSFDIVVSTELPYEIGYDAYTISRLTLNVTD